MRQITVGQSESSFLSARLALDAQRIRYMESRDFAWGDGVRRPANYLLVDDDDYERAMTALSGLQDSPMVTAEMYRSKGIVITLAIFLVVFLVLLVATVRQH